MTTAFGAYISDPVNQDYVSSPEFERRSCRLFDRLKRGERINLRDASISLGLPLAVFAELLPMFLAQQRAEYEDAHAVRH